MLTENPWKMKPLRGDIGIFTEKGGTIAYLLSKKGIVVVDAEYPEQAGHLIGELKKQSDKPFELLINTHHHDDHTSGNIAFKGLVQHVAAADGLIDVLSNKKINTKMRKIILTMHVSLDGFVGGPNGEMDWIHVDEAIFEYSGKMTDEADTALYGRVTWEMMDSYWPTAADQPTAGKHDIEHSRWYNSVGKIVLSRTLQGSNLNNVSVISDNIEEEIKKLKAQTGKNIQIFGSPSASHVLMQYNLIDEYWLFVNPVVLGQGIPLFGGIKERVGLTLVGSKAFDSGVVGLHYKSTR